MTPENFKAKYGHQTETSFFLPGSSATLAEYGVRKQLREKLEELQESCPLPMAVRLCFSIKGLRAGADFACCRVSTTKAFGRHWLITINPGLTANEALDCLIHEYAHAMTECIGGTELTDTLWGIAYAKAYASVHGPH